MANKGETKCLKSNNVGFVHKFNKSKKFVISINCGKHNKKNTVSIGYVLRDILHLADNKKELMYIINNKEVLVDNKMVKSINLPVGLYDIIKIPRIKKIYKAVIQENSLINLVEITDKEAKYKICKIIFKKIIKDNNIQLTSNDGRIITTTNNAYKTKASVKLDLEENTIKEYYPLEKGRDVLIIGGKHIGAKGKITNVSNSTINKQSLIKLKSTSGEEFETTEKNVLVVN
jgi:small subunit ribosomal protein S4e